MADFITAYKKTSVFEGGYANDPADHGGETWKGISRKNFPHWEGWELIDAYKAKSNFPQSLKTNYLLETMVQVFYKANFWANMRGDAITNQEAANELYDSCVNNGSHTGIALAQRALSMHETGVVDSITLDKINGQ